MSSKTSTSCPYFYQPPLFIHPFILSTSFFASVIAGGKYSISEFIQKARNGQCSLNNVYVFVSLLENAGSKVLLIPSRIQNETFYRYLLIWLYSFRTTLSRKKQKKTSENRHRHTQSFFVNEMRNGMVYYAYFSFTVQRYRIYRFDNVSQSTLSVKGRNRVT